MSFGKNWDRRWIAEGMAPASARPRKKRCAHRPAVLEIAAAQHATTPHAMVIVEYLRIRGFRFEGLVIRGTLCPLVMAEYLRAKSSEMAARAGRGAVSF
jgi:hypothetical protein